MPDERIPKHPDRPAMMKCVSRLNYPHWKLIPHTILKAHIHYLLATGEVDASTLDIAHWSHVSPAVATKYRFGLERLGVLSIEQAIRGQRQRVYLHSPMIKILTNSHGPKLVKIANEKPSKLFAQNTQENHGYRFKKERRRGKKTGFNKIASLVGLDAGQQSKSTNLYDANDSEDAEKMAQVVALLSKTEGRANG